MITAKHQAWAEFLFDHYTSRLVNKHFCSLHLLGNFPEIVLGKPILFLPNHSTWWDGFLIYRLNKYFYKRPLYSMMLEKELLKYPFFSRVGAYSIWPGHPKKVMESIRFTRLLLNSTANVKPSICIFPQGELNPRASKPIRFKPGIDWILKDTHNPVAVILVGIIVKFLEQQRPQVFFKLDYSEYIAGKQKINSQQLAQKMEILLDEMNTDILNQENGHIFFSGTRSVSEKWHFFKKSFLE
jgi:1-acyl-sn-glycerol-3-phosphate acyltransferase